MKKRMIVMFLAAVMLPGLACWIEIPLDQVVARGHVVVIGEITEIEHAERPEDEREYRYDIAQITVQEVLRNTLADQDIEAGGKIPLAMPSVNNVMMISTDIRYGVGRKGIWILWWHDGAFRAGYPKDFQPMEMEEEVRELLARLLRELEAEVPEPGA